MKTLSLSRPPITEAILDVRLKQGDGFDIENLNNIHEKVKSIFPIKQVNTQWETQFELKKGEEPRVKSKDTSNGFIFKTQDGSKIFQARKDGFTFNRINNYPGWKIFSGEAKEYLNIYFEYIPKPLITRVALRYINLVNIPKPFSDFKEYFLTGPEIAKDLPQGVAEHFMRLVVPDTKSKNVAIIIEAVDPSKVTRSLSPLIFDIDVFRQTSDLDLNEKLLWEIFEEIRDYKNRIFFGSFTDKALKLFN